MKATNEQGRLFGVSDLHVSHPSNRTLLDQLHPESSHDWLLVAGDVAERLADVKWALGRLRERFATVVWTPGNHELWTSPAAPDDARGLERYEQLIATCRDLNVLTPEDPYPTWHGVCGPVVVAPVFVLYDYSFHAPGTSDRESSLAAAYEAGVVCTDEFLLHPDPFADRAEWCASRVAYTLGRLQACESTIPLVLVSHWPLVREPTRLLRHPEFAQWCVAPSAPLIGTDGSP